jgi:hypothetical protein
MTRPGQNPALDDRQQQRVVLDYLLHAFPEQLTLDELIRELATDSSSFLERDVIANAVRDLVGAGLLHRNAQFLTPTHAALTAHKLLDEL